MEDCLHNTLQHNSLKAATPHRELVGGFAWHRVQLCAVGGDAPRLAVAGGGGGHAHLARGRSQLRPGVKEAWGGV